MVRNISLVKLFDTCAFTSLPDYHLDVARIVLVLHRLGLKVEPIECESCPEIDRVEIDRVFNVELCSDREGCYCRVVALLELDKLQEGVEKHDDRDCDAAART